MIEILASTSPLWPPPDEPCYYHYLGSFDNCHLFFPILLFPLFLTLFSPVTITITILNVLEPWYFLAPSAFDNISIGRLWQQFSFFPFFISLLPVYQFPLPFFVTSFCHLSVMAMPCHCWSTAPSLPSGYPLHLCDSSCLLFLLPFLFLLLLLSFSSPPPLFSSWFCCLVGTGVLLYCVSTLVHTGSILVQPAVDIMVHIDISSCDSR